MLEKQKITLNAITKSKTLEIELLETFKDDLESFKLIWPFMSFETVQSFREKFPEYAFTQKSEEEIIWESLYLY